MPKLPIDYSKTIIYKICCKDINITDIYVGHTTDLTRRRQKHKHTCNNENNKHYNYNVYQFIRENGGWDNWSLIPIEEFPCENVNQALIRERYYIEELKASLNKVKPTRTRKEWREDNREKLKEYREEHKEHYKEIKKKYYENNKENNKEHLKEYYQKNKDKINEKNKEKLKEKFTCECGGKYIYTHKSRHLKSQIHQDYLTQTIPA